MKKIIFIVFIGLFLYPITGKTQFNLADMYQGWFPRKDNTPKLMHRLTVDLVFNRWLEEPSTISLEPYSFGVNVYRMIDIPFTHRFGIGIGLGFSSQNFHHNGQFVTTIDSSGNEFTTIEPFAAGYDYRRNKISMNYFDIPFELRFRSKENPRFSVYPGFKAGYLFNAHTKTIDGTGKYKNYNIPGFDRFHYGISLRMGWGKAIQVYTFYQLSSMFEKGKGEVINPFEIGFTVYIF